jgi:hypothetical protein
MLLEVCPAFDEGVGLFEFVASPLAEVVEAKEPNALTAGVGALGNLA